MLSESANMGREYKERQDKSRQGKEKKGKYKARQGKARQGKARKGRARQEKTFEADKTAETIYQGIYKVCHTSTPGTTLCLGINVIKQ